MILRYKESLSDLLKLKSFREGMTGRRMKKPLTRSKFADLNVVEYGTGKNITNLSNILGH